MCVCVGGGGGGGEGGSVCSLANHSIAYEETPSNRVSDFPDFVCSLFPKAVIFYLFCLDQCNVAFGKAIG